MKNLIQVSLSSVLQLSLCSMLYVEAHGASLQIVAKTGTKVGGQTLSNIRPGVSINRDGTIAWVASTSSGRSTVFVRTPDGEFRDLQPQSSIVTGFGAHVNDSNQVVFLVGPSVFGSDDCVPAPSPAIGCIETDSQAIASYRLLGVNALDPRSSPRSETLVYSLVFNAQNTSVEPQNGPWTSIGPAFSVNRFGQTAFIGDISANRHESRYALGTVTYATNFPPPLPVDPLTRPLIADNGNVVFKASPTEDSPVRLATYALSSPITIASTNEGFAWLGLYPGITDSGQRVSFTGRFTGDTNIFPTGDGLFLSTFANGKWINRLVLGTNHWGTNVFSRFHSYYRTCVSDLSTRPNSVRICFGAASPTGRVGLYAVTYDYKLGEASGLTKLIEAGQVIDGLGNATSFELFDAVNGCGDVVFWVQTSQGDAVMHAQSGPQITMHRLLPEALVASSTDRIDDALEIDTRSPGFLLLQPEVKEGLVADGVTPLMFQLTTATSLDQPISYKLQIDIDPETGSLRSPISITDHLYVLRGGAFVRDDHITLYSDSPIGIAYLKGIASQDVQLLPGNKFLRLLVSMESTNDYGCQKEIKLSKPPMVLIHGYNADKSTWREAFHSELFKSRLADFVIPIDYGVNGGSAKNYFNTYGSLGKLVSVLNQVLSAGVESPSFNLRKGWAFTRYDVIAHSQGGILARLLCTDRERCIPPFADCVAPFRSSENSYRGRFHRVVTIGSPHNGSTAVYYVFRIIETSGEGSLFASVVLDSWQGVLQPKFDPFRGEIVDVNAWEIDPSAKIHLIRTTIPPCPFLENRVHICDDCGTGTSRRSVVLPAGSDGIVDLDSQGGGYNPPLTPVTDFLESGILGGISHSGPELVFGVESGATQTGSPFIASEVRYLLDGSAESFGRFPQPPRLTDLQRSIIDSCIPYLDQGIAGHNIVFSTQMSQAAGDGSSSSYYFTLTALPNRPLRGAVSWFAQTFSTNGLSASGISLAVSSHDSTRVAVTLDDSLRGDVVLYATYPSTNGIVVVASPVLVVSRPVGTGLAGIEIVPSPNALAVGQWCVPEIWGLFSNGLRSRLFVSPSNGPLVYASAPGVVETGSNGLVRAVAAGSMTLVANYRGFTAQAQITVAGIPASTATLTNLALRPDAIYLFDYAKTKQVDVFGQFSDGVDRKLSAGDQRIITIDPSVATVTTDGLVEARGLGQTTLWVRSGAMTVSVPILVLGTPFTNAPPPPTQSLEITRLGSDVASVLDVNNSGEVLLYLKGTRPAIWKNGLIVPLALPVSGGSAFAYGLSESGVACGISSGGPTLWMDPTNIVYLRYTNDSLPKRWYDASISDIQDTDTGLGGILGVPGDCGDFGNCAPPTLFRTLGVDVAPAPISAQGIPLGYRDPVFRKLNRKGKLIGDVRKIEFGALVSVRPVTLDTNDQIELLEGWDGYGGATGINTLGDVVGTLPGGYATLWQGGKVNLLTTGEATSTAINNQGHVAVYRAPIFGPPAGGSIWVDGKIVALADLFPRRTGWTGFGPVAALNDRGWLICNAGDGTGDIPVLIKLAPSISQQPISRTKVPGQSARFSVESFAFGNVRYQWRRNGVALSNDARISGANTQELDVKMIQVDDAGSYDLVVNDSYGMTLSSNATLTVFGEGCLPSTNGLVAHWSGDEHAQEMLNRYSATLMNGTTFSNGYVKSAFSFDGIDDFVTTDLEIDTDSTPVMTWEAWVYPTWTQRNQSQMILSDTLGYRAVGIDTGTDQFVVFTGHSLGSGRTAAVSRNQWQHIAVVFYSDRTEFYKNSERFALQDAPPAIRNIFKLSIGNQPAHSYYFKGLVDEISIYNRALSPVEIQAIYDVDYAGKCRPEESPRILSQPLSQTVYGGYDVSFPISVTGTAPLRYQWFFNETNPIPHGTNVTLDLQNIAPENSGSYSVAISNVFGAITSLSAELNVRPSCENEWTRVATPNVGSFNSRAMAFDSHRGVTVLLEDDRTWEWNGVNWRLASTRGLDVPGPGPRFGTKMVYDSGRRVMVVFGGGVVMGIQGTVLVNDTWEWDGTSWTLAASSGPSPRSEHAMAYDPVKQVTVLFGGYGGPCTSFGDTWIWDGFEWCQSGGSGATCAPQACIQPAARRAHDMVYDATLGRVILFGGVATDLFDFCGQPSNDTWFWDGSCWETVSTTQSPPPRYYFSMVYDSLRRSTILYGGSGLGDETWEFIQNSWVRVPTYGPGGKAFHSLAYDGIRDAIVLGAGPEIWEWSAPKIPKLQKQPFSQTRFIGEAITLSSCAVGSGSLKYQWLFEGREIPGATSANLAFGRARPDLAGQYSVVVSNNFGSVTSVLASIQVLPCQPAPTGMVAWWRAEGDRLDSALTNHGIMGHDSIFASGKVGQAIVINGTSNMVRIPASSSLNLTIASGITIEGWIYPRDLNSHPLVEWNQGNGTEQAVGVQFWTSVPQGGGGAGSLFANIRRTNLVDNIVSTAPGLLVSDAWQHVAMTYNRGLGLVTLYLNGVVRSQASVGSFRTATTWDVYLGGQPGTTNAFAGLLDEFAIYNRALGSNELATIFAAGVVGKCLEPDGTPYAYFNGLHRGRDEVVLPNDLPVSASLLSTFEDSDIRYTLDGSSPTNGSLYVGPFPVTRSSILRAIAYSGIGTASKELFTQIFVQASGPILPSSLQIVSVSDVRVLLAYRGTPGQMSVLQRSTDLRSWTAIGTGLILQDGTAQLRDPAPPTSAAFYRVQE